MDRRRRHFGPKEGLTQTFKDETALLPVLPPSLAHCGAAVTVSFLFLELSCRMPPQGFHACCSHTPDIPSPGLFIADFLPSRRSWSKVIFQRHFQRPYLRALCIHHHFHMVPICFACLKSAAMCKSRTPLTLPTEHLLSVRSYSDVVGMTMSLTKSWPSKSLHSTGEHR